jgi:hypothetical protein
MSNLIIPLNFWFTKSTEISIPIISFNHHIKSSFSFNSLFTPDELNKIKEKGEINDLCDKLSKLYIPLTYDELINSLNDIEKQNMKKIIMIIMIIYGFIIL